MIHRVGAKGQVVIPKEIRDRLSIRAGDRVTFWCDGDSVSVRRVTEVTSLVGCLSAEAGLAGDLLAERRADREREDLGNVDTHGERLSVMIDRSH